MKQKQLLRTLLAAVCLLVGTSAWGAEPTLTLTSSYAVDNYAKLCYFDFGGKTVDDESTYADVVNVGGYTESTTRGIQDQTASASTTPITITKSIQKGDLIVIQAGQTSTYGMSVTVSSTVSNPIKNDGYYVYYVTADAESFTIKLNRLNYVRAMLILRPSNTTYVVNAVTSDGTFLKEIATGEYTADATVYYPYGIMKDGVCYAKAKSSSEPYWGFTNIAAGLRTIVYTANDWAYYGELEDMTYYKNGSSNDGLRDRAFTPQNRFSYGDAKRFYNKMMVYSSSLSAGIYSVNLYGRNSKNAERSGIGLKLRDSSGKFITLGSFGTWGSAETGTKTVANVIVPEGYNVCVYESAGYNSDIDLDYVYVEKTGNVESDVALAIYDCEAYETSAEFDTHIRGLLANGDLSSAADVYAAHTAWQIAQADASSSNDYTKVIRNAAVADATDWDGAGTYSGEQYTGAPDNTFIDNYGAQMWATQWIYGLPAGKYQVKVATRAHADNYSHVYVSNGSYDICSARGTNVGNTEGELGNGWSWTYVPFEITETTNILLGFYKDATQWAGADDWHLYKVTEDQSFEITSTSGWATLYTPYALDFYTLSESLTAYTATFDGSTVELKKVTDVPARTGVVLKGSKGTYDIPLAASSSTAQGDLKGSPTWATNYDSSYKFYYLALNTNNQAQFKVLNTGGSIAAGKAYLQVDNSTGSAKALNVVFASDPTGIANVNAVETAQPAKRIVNGQLVIEKNGKRYNAAGAEF